MFRWDIGIGKVLRQKMRQDAARREELALRQRRVSRFCSETVMPALESLRPELEAHGRGVEIQRVGNIVHFRVFHEGRVEFQYSVLASRRNKAAIRTNGYYRDRHGYGRNVDRIYSQREMRWLGKRAVIMPIVAEFRKMIEASSRVRL